MEGPLVRLLEDQPVDAVEVPAGWTARQGFDLPDEPWDLTDRRWMCVGTVRDGESVRAAMEAVARGVGLTVAVEVSGIARHQFLEDLYKATPPERYVASPRSPTARPDEHDRLLDALARGTTVTAAAEELHISRRTANRILAEIRRELGVETTAEAVSRWSAARPTG